MVAALLPSDCLRWATTACALLLISYSSFMVVANDDESNPCLLYLAESTIPGGEFYNNSLRLSIANYISYHSYILSQYHKAGLGMFAGANFPLGKQIGRVGDAAFPTVDHDWHNSPMSGASASKHEADYHWPLTNYDWNAPDIGMENEAEDVSVTVTGFGGTFVCCC